MFNAECEQGAPQGRAISPLLGNISLVDFDRLLESAKPYASPR
jgi:hypothetical protein